MRVLTSPAEWPAGAQRLQQKQEVQMRLASQRVCCAFLCFQLQAAPV